MKQRMLLVRLVSLWRGESAISAAPLGRGWGSYGHLGRVHGDRTCCRDGCNAPGRQASWCIELRFLGGFDPDSAKLREPFPEASQAGS